MFQIQNLFSLGSSGSEHMLTEPSSCPLLIVSSAVEVMLCTVWLICLLLHSYNDKKKHKLMGEPKTKIPVSEVGRMGS
jgi:hypothetical protein